MIKLSGDRVAAAHSRLSRRRPGALAADPGITDTEILIGDVEPLTGPPALLGVAASIGHKIAIAEANAAGGINGRKIKYVLEDDGYVTARTIQGVKKVIDVDKVFAMLGISGSGQSIAVMPVLEKAGIPTVIDVAPVKHLVGAAAQERVRGRAILRGRHRPPRQLSRRQEPRQEMGPDHPGRRLRHRRARRLRYRGQGQEAQRGLQRQLQEGPAGLLVRHAAAQGVRRRGVPGRRHHRREHRDDEGAREAQHQAGRPASSGPAASSRC